MAKRYGVLILCSFCLMQNGLAQDRETETQLYRVLRNLLGEGLENYVDRDISYPGEGIKRKHFLRFNSVSVALFVEDVDFKLKRVYDDFVVNDEQIVHATFKADDPTKLLILFSNGRIDRIEVRNEGGEYKWKMRKSDYITTGQAMDTFKKILGDALYILSAGKVFVSRDTAVTWQIDSAGISKTYAVDIAVDSNNYAWCATTNGLFTQHPDSNIWRKNSALPSNNEYCQSIGIDRRGRIFVGTTQSVFVSTNGGASWTDVKNGINNIVTSFGDDKFGNVYAITYSAAFRLSNLTPPWEKISDSIAAHGYTVSTDNMVRFVGGDSIIWASTKYGLFMSTDSGNSWSFSEPELQPQAYQFFGLVRSGNYHLVSTSLGVFRVADGDTMFTKVFPVKGNHSGLPLHTDSAGNIYTMAPQAVNQAVSGTYNFKSTDHGTTWVPDTLGIKKINLTFQYAKYFADDKGNQYAAGTQILYSKKPDGPWKVDTSGLMLKGGNLISTVSTRNKKGTVYAVKTIAVSNDGIYKRSLNDTVWTKVDAAVLGTALFKIESDNEGNVIAVTNAGGIFKYNGTSWTVIQKPAQFGTSGTPDQFMTDKNGVLWMSFYSFVGSPPQFTYNGLFFLEPGSSAWKFAGLDSIGVAFLAPVADTVYAVTYVTGIHGFTTAPVTAVKSDEARVVLSHELYQNYPNPFNPATTITFQISEVGGQRSDVSRVMLKVYDLLGREVATLVNEEMKAGKHSIRFDASTLSSGIYFYTLRANNFNKTKKMLMLK